MFIDEETETFMKNSSILGSDKQVGLWRIIVVHNVPYTDSRRNGKVCFFLCGFLACFKSLNIIPNQLADLNAQIYSMLL